MAKSGNTGIASRSSQVSRVFNCPQHCQAALSCFLTFTILTMPTLHDAQTIHNATQSFLFARDAKSTLTPNATQRTTLIVAGCYIVAIAILWCVRIAVEDKRNSKGIS